MTGPEHYDEAQRCLLEEGCEYACPHSGCPHEMAIIARAQAHATLALAAATAMQSLDLGPGSWRGDWMRAIGTGRQPAAEEPR